MDKGPVRSPVPQTESHPIETITIITLLSLFDHMLVFSHYVIPALPKVRGLKKQMGNS
jgi:hypothetical protein